MGRWAELVAEARAKSLAAPKFKDDGLEWRKDRAGYWSRKAPFEYRIDFTAFRSFDLYRCTADMQPAVFLANGRVSWLMRMAEIDWLVTAR